MDPENSAPSVLPLDALTCRRARLSRDTRFDGEFFLGVRTTGIYCRPICPARAPAERNVSYYRNAAQAAAAGLRPCLRCRPESAPGSPAWQGTSATTRRALRLIQEGALNTGSLRQLADRLGIGERYLRKLFHRDFGVSPKAMALNLRLLFARKLLAETSLPMIDVAYAAGFGSLRRFNSAIRSQFRQTPGALRAQRGKYVDGEGIRLQLHYRPPYDWSGVIGFFARHAVAGVETVTDNCYRRNIVIAGQAASITVTPIVRKSALQLQVSVGDPSLVLPIVHRVRRMFDLDANPAAVYSTLNRDPMLTPLLATATAVRAPGHWSVFESAVRAIVGQQVSTAAARSVCARLACAAAADQTQIQFPCARDIGALTDEHFPMPGRRRDTLRELCRQFTDRDDELESSALAKLKGVGNWTVVLVALRGEGNPDAFPSTDLGLLKAWRLLPNADLPLAQHARCWRPWRAYAANLLWRSLNT